MTLLLLLLLMLIPLTALAQTAPPMPHGGNITVIPTQLDASYWSSNGGSVDVIRKEPGTQMFFSRDRYGNANGMGFINQPFIDRPLTVPQSRYRTDGEIDRNVCATLIRC